MQFSFPLLPPEERRRAPLRRDEAVEIKVYSFDYAQVMSAVSCFSARSAWLGIARTVNPC
jgi:hypothetical protein